MIALLEQILGAVLGWFNRMAGPPGALPPVPPGRERGWPMWCPGCRFMLSRPSGGYLSCPHCHWYSPWPPPTPGEIREARGGKRRFNIWC
jgi:hypothetical protein